jgi:outer membrane protein assembly factor BamB
MSTLPRLRPAWTFSGLETEQWRYQEGVPAFDGTLIGWSTGPDKRMVAIDVATGKERWRSPEPYNAPVYVEFAKGLVLVNGFGGMTTALARDTGRIVWTAKLCGFYDHVRDDGHIGFVRCKGPDRDVTSSPGPTRYLVGTAFLIAFDLASGRLLWRREAGAGMGADNVTDNATIGRKHVYVFGDGKLRGLDPGTGKELWAFRMPEPAWDWAVLDVEPGGRDLALLTSGGSAGVRAAGTIAIRLSDKARVWSGPTFQKTSEGYRLAARDGRLFGAGQNEIVEIDLGTGTVASTCPLPRVSEYTLDRRWRLMRGDIVAILDAGRDRPPVVVRCGKQGNVTAVPPPPTPGWGFWRFAAAWDGTLVFRSHTKLAAFSVFDVGPSEQSGLPPRERVRAILDRADRHPSDTAGSIRHNRAVFEELRAIPGHAATLLALAKDATFSQRDRAVDAATALRIPGVVELLLREIFRSLPVPPTLSEERLSELNVTSRLDLASDEYARDLWRRADQIVLLAAMDDAKAATRLGPLLLARSTPEALGWWDWNIWGRSGEDRFGMPAWDGRSRSERRAHNRSSTISPGHSELVTASAGRSEAHAAIYRLLARLGRREDVARLDALDRATARAGGWSTICDADDAVKEPGPARLWVEPWGVCRGIDVGDFRVTQGRSLLWLRRRLPDGSLGPPAAAGDLGGDQCNDQRRMQGAALRDGRIEVKIDLEKSFVRAIDPAATFADADGDGLPDATEAAFGTDPKRADTDGDGLPDGRDPAPLVGPISDVRAEVAGEIVRYGTLFLVGGPLTLKAERELWGAAPGAAALLLHLPPDTTVDDQMCDLGSRKDSGTSRGLRPPFPLARVESLQITGDNARGRLRWATGGGHKAHDLTLRLVRGKWRVTGDHTATLPP